MATGLSVRYNLSDTALAALRLAALSEGRDPAKIQREQTLLVEAPVPEALLQRAYWDTNQFRVNLTQARAARQDRAQGYVRSRYEAGVSDEVRSITYVEYIALSELSSGYNAYSAPIYTDGVLDLAGVLDLVRVINAFELQESMKCTITEAEAKAQAQAEAEATLPALVAQAQANYRATREKSQREEAEKAAAKQARELERATWISEHGSDFLKAAVGAGYNCQRRYITERVAVELGEGWDVDFKDGLDTKDRSCPSEGALECLLALPEKTRGEILWATLPGNEYDDPREAEIVTANVPYTSHYVYRVF